MPLLIYFVAHDAAEILLVLILGSLLGAGTGGAEFTAVFVTNQGTLQAVLGALAALLGTAAIWPALKRELEAGGKGAGPGCAGNPVSEDGRDPLREAVSVKAGYGLCVSGSSCFCLSPALISSSIDGFLESSDLCAGTGAV